jgi:hypothetical protein
VTQRHIRVIALDFGGTISLDTVDHLIAQKPVDLRSRSTTEVRCRRGARPLGRTDDGPWRSVVGTAR